MSLRSSVIPELIDALIELAADLFPDVTVCDGLPIEMNTGDYFCVGIDDPDNSRPASAARSTEEWADLSGFEVDEVGQVTCVVWSNSASSEMKATRDAVFGYHAKLRDAIRDALAAPPDTLGIVGLWDVRVGGVDDYNQAQDGEGATAILRFPIPFQARI